MKCYRFLLLGYVQSVYYPTGCWNQLIDFFFFLMSTLYLNVHSFDYQYMVQ